MLRIPTGGIEFNETAEEALYREVKEELGVSFDVEKFEGLIEYERIVGLAVGFGKSID